MQAYSHGRQPRSAVDSGRTRGPRGFSLRRAAVLGAAVVVGAIVLAVSRAQSLATGLPCDARGPYECGFDPTLYLVIALIVGLVVLAVGWTAAAAASRRSSRLPGLLYLLTAFAWAFIWAALLIGTRR